MNDDEMLEELKKIRMLLEPKPAPSAPAAPKGVWNEFKDFLSKYKVLGLAIAFIMGVYLGGLVQSLVKDLILPVVGLGIPGWETWRRTRLRCRRRLWMRRVTRWTRPIQDNCSVSATSWLR